MSNPKTLDIVGANRTYSLKLVAQPPPQVRFLGSQVMSAVLDEQDQEAAVGGLAALMICEFDGEAIEIPRLPRTLPELLDLGRGFVMLAFDKCRSYEEVGRVFIGVMNSSELYRANPT